MTKSKKPSNKTVQIMNNSDCIAESSLKKKKKNKKRSKSSNNHTKTQANIIDTFMNHHVIRHGGNHANNNIKEKNKENDNFWSSPNNIEERQKIREFWLQLGEEERRSLVKMEREAVLRKMKEQQKHICNCSVCGKKRNAIEDELEVLYDAYYEELEQYANHQQQTRSTSSSAAAFSLLHSINYIRGDNIYQDAFNNTLDEDEDEDAEDNEEEEDEKDTDISNDEEEGEEDDEEENNGGFDDESSLTIRSSMSAYPKKKQFEELTHIEHIPSRLSSNSGHFNLESNLTAKGGILTMADDLLKNNGKNFLDMMERLAERRIQREDILLNQSSNYVQEEDDAYEKDEKEAIDTRTEEQRMEEGRRMFQIFAARMFEQRVLVAYREKVARERQQRLLEELEEEDRLREEREAKRQSERERKKDRKRQLKKQKEEQRLALEAKKKAEEEVTRKQKERKLEEERQKREKERLKKEEEHHRNEEERKRKVKEERERERKRKEKEGKECKEREDKERKDKEERERKAKEQKEKKEKFEEKESLKSVETIISVAKEVPKVNTKNEVSAPVSNNTSADFESRQQTLIEALVGSSSRLSSFVEPASNQPFLAQLPHLKSQQPFMPIPHHLEGTFTSFFSTLVDHPSPLSDSNPSVLGLLNSRSTSPSALFLSESPSTRRPITPIAPIGQPVHNGHQTSSMKTSRTIGSLPDDSILGSKQAEPERDPTGSFFSNFLFGEPTRCMKE
ncbi:hypothetical protein G6F28_000829 [Rhizopus arrhizus]|nr:hypothetical protein G6F28_000829 [Rhizopus arrhizus]